MKQKIFLWILFVIGLIALFLPWQATIGGGIETLFGYNIIIGADLGGYIYQHGIATTINNLIFTLPLTGGYWIGLIVFLLSLILRKVKLFRLATGLMLYGIIATGLVLKIVGGFGFDVQYYSYFEIGYWLAVMVTIICIYLSSRKETLNIALQ
jgi:hypothetical protein